MSTVKMKFNISPSPRYEFVWGS